jgi:hypothetical protein
MGMNKILSATKTPNYTAEDVSNQGPKIKINAQIN